MLMDINTLKWSEELCEAFGVPITILPSICPSAHPYGTVSHPELFQCLKGIPITGCVGDQQSACLGQMLMESELKNTLGTGAFLVLNTGSRIISTSGTGLLTTVLYQLPDKTTYYGIEGAIGVAGQVIDFLQSNGIINSPKECSKNASEIVRNNSLLKDLYFVSSFNGLLFPHFDPTARGIIVGLTQATNRNDLCYAALEGVAMQTSQIVDAMKASLSGDQDIKDDEKNSPIEKIKVDGGLSQSNEMLQIMADCCGIVCERPYMIETTSLGAAVAAGIGYGLWRNLKEAQQYIQSRTDNSKQSDLFKPQMSSETRNERQLKWQEAVTRAEKWSDQHDEKKITGKSSNSSKVEKNPETIPFYVGLACGIFLGVLISKIKFGKKSA
ncbi:glycerol kinase isoform a [Reticulomyxa filosa]|uniref:glycerol kinase n=1 Tax=Reticulomyxa filosa TaxID=46433 RepID=X6P0I3_RETFI|nr:glycerol kinase isoform a [Reticulomyxa filosa]|eukprot:ETO32070.1 glycerol kinase isoform a [Reticulomyxa filosa]